MLLPKSVALARRGAIGSPSTTTHRLNGSGTSSLSHVLSRTPREQHAAYGTTHAPARRPNPRAPRCATLAGPLGPSTAIATSHPRSMLRSSPRMPPTAPRDVDPRAARTPNHLIAQHKSSPSPDRLTSATVPRRRRCASSSTICPCQSAYTQGTCPRSPRLGCVITRMRQVKMRQRATSPRKTPTSARTANVARSNP